MTDLRQRLVDAIKPLAGGEPSLHGTNEEEVADEALAVFAGWLRERGGQLEPILHSPRILLTVLANEIEPKGAAR